MTLEEDRRAGVVETGEVVVAVTESSGEEENGYGGWKGYKEQWTWKRRETKR